MSGRPRVCGHVHTQMNMFRRTSKEGTETPTALLSRRQQKSRLLRYRDIPRLIVVRTPSVVSGCGCGYRLQTSHLESHRQDSFVRKPVNPPNHGSLKGPQPHLLQLTKRWCPLHPQTFNPIDPCFVGAPDTEKQPATGTLRRRSDTCVSDVTKKVARDERCLIAHS